MELKEQETMEFETQKPIAVANYIINCGNELNKPVSNLQLQKIMYFAQGEFLAKYDQPLIDGQFSRWQYGPVLREVYSIFKYNGPLPIHNVAVISNDIFTMIDKKKAEVTTAESLKNEEIFSKFKDIIIKLLNTEPWALVDLSHEQKIWSDYEEEIKEHSAPDYTDDEIKETFKEMKYSWAMR